MNVGAVTEHHSEIQRGIYRGEDEHQYVETYNDYDITEVFAGGFQRG